MKNFCYLLVSLLFLYSVQATALTTNEKMINELYLENELNIDNVDEVFEYVLSQTDDTLTIYPSEGYYYFSFYHQGNLIKGNLLVGHKLRQQGTLSFIYFYDIAGKERGEFKTHHKLYKTSAEFSLKKTKPNLYQLNFKKIKKNIKINQLVTDASFVNTLEQHGFEVNIPMMDESGVQFYLAFYPATNNFYYINDLSRDDEFYYTLGEGLKVGARTEFVYLPMDKFAILVGVNAANIYKNNYYDGPFDQLPDEALEGINYKSYLYKVNPSWKEQIYDDGYFINDSTARVGLTNYFEYLSLDEFQKIQPCVSDKNPLQCLEDKGMRF
ncbi:hypothetical protein ACTXLD_07220 [Psychrobacter faecalis]